MSPAASRSRLKRKSFASAVRPMRSERPRLVSASAASAVTSTLRENTCASSASVKRVTSSLRDTTYTPSRVKSFSARNGIPNGMNARSANVPGLMNISPWFDAMCHFGKREKHGTATPSAVGESAASRASASRRPRFRASTSVYARETGVRPLCPFTYHVFAPVKPRNDATSRCVKNDSADLLQRLCGQVSASSRMSMPESR